MASTEEVGPVDETLIDRATMSSSGIPTPSMIAPDVTPTDAIYR